MLRLVAGLDGRHSFLVSSDGPREIRRFLRENALRPREKGFEEIQTKPFMHLHCYRLTGDEHYKVAALKIPRISWGQLSLYLVQVFHFPRARYGTLAR